MIIAFTYVGVSIAVLLVLTFVYVLEDIKGKRIFLPNVRQVLDVVLGRSIKKIESLAFSFTNGVVRLLLHYGAHSILKRILAVIRTLEQKVEDLVRQNRRIAKSLGSMRTNAHFTAIAEHKEEVALSEKEKSDLLTH